MDEEGNIYAIPANYTDSGKILGGMLSLRNIIEALIADTDKSRRY